MDDSSKSRDKEQVLKWRQIDKDSKLNKRMQEYFGSNKKKATIDLNSRKDRLLKNEYDKKLKSGYQPIEVLSPMFGRDRKKISSDFRAAKIQRESTSNKTYNSVNDYVNQDLKEKRKSTIYPKNKKIFNTSETKSSVFRSDTKKQETHQDKVSSQPAQMQKKTKRSMFN